MKTLKDILLERLVLSKTKSSIAHAVICTEEEILNDELSIEEIDKFNQPFILKHDSNVKQLFTYFHLLLNGNIIGIIEYNNYFSWINLIVPLKTYKNLTGLYDYPRNEDDYIELDTNIKRCILMLDERFENKQLISIIIHAIHLNDMKIADAKISLSIHILSLTVVISPNALKCRTLNCIKFCHI
jgi:hypothetical protein